MSTCVLKALPGKLDIERHSPSILYLYTHALLSSWEISLKFLSRCARSEAQVNLRCSHVRYVTSNNFHEIGELAN